MSERDRQLARRNRRDGLTGPARARREREPRGELLIAQVLDALSQRDALVEELELRAGRALVEIRTLGWPTARETADACGLAVREAARLRALVKPLDEPGPMSEAALIVGGSTTASDVRRRQRFGEE